jgi:hypothetical protein
MIDESAKSDKSFKRGIRLGGTTYEVHFGEPFSQSSYSSFVWQGYGGPKQWREFVSITMTFASDIDKKVKDWSNGHRGPVAT